MLFLLMLCCNVVEGQGAVKMDPPKLLYSSATALSVGWVPPAGASVSAFELYLGGKSVYTGSEQSFLVQRLTPGQCHEFSVRALLEMEGWSEMSAILRAPTLDLDVPDMLTIETRLSAFRERILRAAVAEVTLDTCPLAGYASPEYVDGTVDSAVFLARVDRFSGLAISLASENCKLGQCDPILDSTKPFSQGMQGVLKVPVDSSWQIGGVPDMVNRFVSLPAEGAVISYSDPRAATQRFSISLLGCRAGLTSGNHTKTKDTSPPESAPVLLHLQDSHIALRSRKDTVTAGRARTGRGLVTLPRNCFEVNCTRTASQYHFCVDGVVRDSARLAGSAGATSAASWVTATNFASIGVQSPQKYECSVKLGLASAVPESPRRLHQKGGLEIAVYREAWILSFVGALTLSKSCLLFPVPREIYRCTSLPDKFVQPPFGGAAAGALPRHTAGGAFIATSRSIQMNGAGGGSASTFHWASIVADSFQTDLQSLLDSFLQPVLTAKFFQGILLQLVHGLAVGRHAFGLHHNNLLRLSNIKLQQLPPGSPDRRTHLCLRLSPEVMVASPIQAHAKSAQNFSNSRRGNGDMDFLFKMSDFAAAGACRKPEAVRGNLQHSWCARMDDMDGLILKLHDFSASSISRKQLEWWNEGYTFPNTGWRDDLRDAALIICPILQEKCLDCEGFSFGAIPDFCRAMKSGAFAFNPAKALSHRLFSGSAGLKPYNWESTAEVLLYSYDPATVAELSPVQRGKVHPESAPGNLHPTVTDAAKPSATPPAVSSDTPSSDAKIMKMLQPRRPWIASKNSEGVVVQWDDIADRARLPSSVVVTYNLFLNGQSLYSGTASSFQFPMAGRTLDECLVFEVAAFFRAIGWTPKSPPLQVNECSGS